MTRSPIVVLLALSLAVGSLASCTVARFLEGEPGTDLVRVSAGASREQIEAALGTVVRQWQTSLGVRYRMYEYDAGAPPNAADAAGMVFMDIASAGFGEVIIAAAQARGQRAFRPHHYRGLLAVSYGADDRAIGIFVRVTELSVLPEDGRVPLAAPAPTPSQP